MHHESHHPNHEHQPNHAHEELPQELLEQLDEDELEALQAYRMRRRPESSTEAGPLQVERFRDAYWGTYRSVQEFVDCWAYEMEPLESVELLFHEQSHPGAELNIAEMALVSHLAEDITFVFDNGKVYVFAREEEQ